MKVHSVAAVQIIGHAELWTRIFDKLGLKIDDNLLDILVLKDEAKMRKKMRDQTKEGKMVWSTVKYENSAADHKA